MKSIVRSLVVTVLLAVAASVGVSTPAQATVTGYACQTANGRTVAVDFSNLGGGLSLACYTGTATYASDIVPAVGHTLKRDHQGAVCQIDGQSGNGCPPQLMGDDYWHLYWTDGKSGTWTYATVGDGGLKIPCGGGVAWAWKGEPHAVAPTFSGSGTCGAVAPAPKPTPAAKPTTAGSVPGARHSTPAAVTPPDSTATSAPSATTTSSTTASASSTASATTSATSSPTASATDDAVPTGVDPSALPQAAPKKSDGLPWWIAPSIIVLLGAAGGAIWFVRRRS
jgi:hypothetical protein